MDVYYELEVVRDPEVPSLEGKKFKNFIEAKEFLTKYRAPEIAYVYVCQGEERKLIGQLLINA